MAKITITIEDLPNGRLKVACDPSAETMAKRIIGGEKSTSAHGLALAAINAILKEKREQERGKIILPRVLS